MWWKSPWFQFANENAKHGGREGGKKHSEGLSAETAEAKKCRQRSWQHVSFPLPSPSSHLLLVYDSTPAKLSVHPHLKSSFEIVRCRCYNVCYEYYCWWWAGFMTCTTSHATFLKDANRLNSSWNLFRMTFTPYCAPLRKRNSPAASLRVVLVPFRSEQSHNVAFLL